MLWPQRGRLCLRVRFASLADVLMQLRHCLGTALYAETHQGLSFDGEELRQILGAWTQIPGVAIFDDEPTRGDLGQDQHGGPS